MLNPPQNITFTFPPDVVPGSQRAEVTAVGRSVVHLALPEMKTSRVFLMACRIHRIITFLDENRLLYSTLLYLHLGLCWLKVFTSMFVARRVGTLFILMFGVHSW